MTTNPCLSCVKGSLVKVTWRDGYQLATGLQPVEDASRQQAFVTSKWKRTNHSGQPHHPNHCQLFGWKYSAQIQPRWSLFDLWIRSFFLAKSRQTFLFCFSCPARHCLSFTKWEEEEEEEMWSHLRTGQLTNFLCECFEKDPLERLELEFFFFPQPTLTTSLKFSIQPSLSPNRFHSPVQGFARKSSKLPQTSIIHCSANTQIEITSRYYPSLEVRSTSNVKWEGGSNRQPGQDTQLFWVRRLLFCRFTCKSDSWACKSCTNSPNKPIAGR